MVWMRVAAREERDPAIAKPVFDLFGRSEVLNWSAPHLLPADRLSRICMRLGIGTELGQ
jgi:hypothetical protein